MRPAPLATTYTLTAKPHAVHRDVDHAHIPDHADNVDWQNYQDWLAAGNTPNPYVPPPKTKQQEAADYLKGGLTIQFTSSTTLSGTYPAAAPANHNINAIATSFAYDGKLPNNATTVAIADMAGAVRQFDKNSFTLLMRAIRDFTHNTHLYVMGEAAALPPNSVSKSIEEATPT